MKIIQWVEIAFGRIDRSTKYNKISFFSLLWITNELQDRKNSNKIVFRFSFSLDFRFCFYCDLCSNKRELALLTTSCNKIAIFIANRFWIEWKKLKTALFFLLFTLHCLALKKKGSTEYRFEISIYWSI